MRQKQSAWMGHGTFVEPMKSKKAGACGFPPMRQKSKKQILRLRSG
jgi:hypothetical protein